MIPGAVRSRSGSAAFVVSLMALLAGCATSPPTEPSHSGPSAIASPAVSGSEAATDGRIVAGVTQGRSDYADAVFAITLENTTDEDVAVSSAVLSSPAFDADVVWSGDAVIPAGSTRDLRVPVPGFACPVSTRTLAVVVAYESGGTARSASLVPVDPFAVVERLSEEACTAEAVAATVSMRLDESLPIDGSGRSSVATLSLVLDPVDDPSAADVTIVSVDATTLLSPAEGEPGWSVDRTVRAGDTRSSVDLSVSPARCDAHAIAEDKVGTVLRVRVRLEDGREGAVSVPSSDALRAALYSFIEQACRG